PAWPTWRTPSFVADADLPVVKARWQLRRDALAKGVAQLLLDLLRECALVHLATKLVECRDQGIRVRLVHHQEERRGAGSKLGAHLLHEIPVHPLLQHSPDEPTTGRADHHAGDRE